MPPLKLNLNYKQLSTYFPNISDEQIAKINQAGGYWFNFEWEYNDEYYIISYTRVAELLKKYNLTEHLDNFYFILFFLDQDYQNLKDIFNQDYQDSQKTKALAQFLLTFKTAKPNQSFQLVAKSLTDTAAIKDEAMAKWMCEKIYEAVERRDFGIDVFGEKTLLHLFGINFQDGEPLSMERLEAASKLNPRKSNHNNLLASFILQIRTYLNENTILTTPNDVLLTDAHANLIFDAFEILGYKSRLDIASEPKDYIHSLLRNHAKIIS